LSVNHGKEVLLVPELPELLMLRACPRYVDDMLVFSLRPATPGTMHLLMKRMLDLAGAALILLITSPILALLYILIPLTSEGPSLFRQERLGLSGRPYQLFKFRTMVADAEKGTGPTLATHNDPRVTRLGQFLRVTRLDELPQLLNVLRGEMSLVGPRPERAFFVDQFRSSLPAYNFRLLVKPGITGLAQIMGKYSTDVEDKLRYDLMYLQESSIMLDMKILVLTAGVLLEPQKAAGLRTPPKWFVPPRTRPPFGPAIRPTTAAAIVPTAEPFIVPEHPARPAA
jgi:exopolysaccharide biosynthesis polyprenyl glycosylphosphotransferase